MSTIARRASSPRSAGAKIEISADVVRRRGRRTRRIRLEQEKLGFHPGVHHEAHRFRFREDGLQRAARIAGERDSPSGRVDVADQPADPIVLIAPRKHEERVEIGREQHVRLLDAHEPFDRRAVEHDVARQRFLELRRRNLDVLVDAKNVGEL